VKRLTEGQHHFVGVLLGIQRPFTADDLLQLFDLTRPLLDNRLNTLVAAGWLTKGKAVRVPGTPGRPPAEYALVAGARSEWLHGTQ
jgi:hypothetical protein